MGNRQGWEAVFEETGKRFCPRYIAFEERDLSAAGWPKDKRTIVVKSRSRGDVLGVLSYHKPWRQWVMDAAPDIIWSHDCLTDVAAKLRELNASVGRSAGAGSQAR